MLTHYLKLAYRNILKDKSTFLINMVGLSTGLACVILIALWVNDELLIDGFHEKGDRLYQAMTLHDNQKEVIVNPITQGLLAAALQQDFPEVAIAVQASVDIPEPFLLTVADTKYKQQGKWVGKDFFQLF